MVTQAPSDRILNDGPTGRGLRNRGSLLVCLLFLGIAAQAWADVIVLQPFDATRGGAFSNLDPQHQQIAGNFSLSQATAVGSFSWFGRYNAILSLTNPVAFSVRFFADAGGVPSVLPLAVFDVMVDALDTGLTFGGIPWFSYSIPLALTLNPGTYWVSVVESDPRNLIEWRWGASGTDGVRAFRTSDGSTWNVGPGPEQAFIVAPSLADAFHTSFDTLATLDLYDPLSQAAGLAIGDTALTTARTLAGPLQPAQLRIKGENLIQLGLDLSRLISTVFNGIPKVLFPFGPLLIIPCLPPQLLFTCVQGEAKGFTSSFNELFQFNLAYQVAASDLGLFHIGDRYVLASPIFSDQTFSIAEVTDISPSGIVTFTFKGVSVLTEILVQIDIKPDGIPNSINRRSAGRIPVAILSSPIFDAPGTVDFLSLTFGRTGTETSLAFCNNHGEDVNGDTLLDLVCHFNTAQTGFQSNDTQGVLKGKTIHNVPISGTDSVRIVK